MNLLMVYAIKKHEFCRIYSYKTYWELWDRLSNANLGNYKK
jgi:hypothetical protein